MNSAGVEIDLRIDFGQFSLDVDLQLPGRGVSVLFGQSGSGKTTLLRCIAGLDRARGRVIVRGEAWQDGRYFVPAHKRPMGYVFQEASLFAHMTVRKNLMYGVKRLKQPANEAQIEHCIDLLGIGHLMDRRPARLSGGERQRVAIAQALAMNPRMLLMDEPLAALDDARKREILPYLQRLHDELDIPLLYITHSLEELTQLADHVVILEQGRVAASGPVEQVLSGFDASISRGEYAGALLNARIRESDERHHLVRAEFAGGHLWIRDADHATGDAVRLRVLARDVSITLEAHGQSSILNQLPATVDAFADSDHPAIKLVRVKVGDSQLLCRMSARSLEALALEPGKPVWVQIKTVALA